MSRNKKVFPDNQSTSKRQSSNSTKLSALFAPPDEPSMEFSLAPKDEESPTRNRRQKSTIDASRSSINQDEEEQETSYQSFDAMRSYDDVNKAQADMAAPSGSISYMMGLFSAPTLNTSANEETIAQQEGEGQTSFSSPFRLQSKHQRESTPLLSSKFSAWTDSIMDTPKTGIHARKHVENNRDIDNHLTAQHIRLPSLAMPAIAESTPVSSLNTRLEGSNKLREYMVGKGRICMQATSKPTTLIGAFMYLLYHIVFCLALGSAINRPNSSTSLLGLMTKTAALGTMSSAMVYWYTLSDEIPALYPTADLFLAPFLANLALKVDEALMHDETITVENNDEVFLATFGFLAGVGICFSGLLLSLSGIFRLANLGSFLPFPVICGFFSAVGILTWTLAITVDTGGRTIGYILKSGDPQLLLFTIIHHTPTVIVASIMKYLGPKNPLFVVMVVFGTIGLFYTIMYFAEISFEEAREMGWFWSRDELVYPRNGPEVMSAASPPSPFGVLIQLCRGMVHWGAVADGMSTAIALGFLYVIRCSVHGAALKKNIPNLCRKAKSSSVEETTQQENTSPTIPRPYAIRSRKFSEAVDIEAVMHPSSETRASSTASSKDPNDMQLVYAKPSNITLKDILVPYGLSQFVSAFFGGFAVTPSVAASGTMFSLGADGLGPQVGSVLLLFVFYLTDFQLVGYIPKPAFSSMLVLAFIDMIYTWFYKSWFKTKDKIEWFVVPAIVFCAFAFDLLSAVFLGIAFSTFLFVASFNQSGVVKYVANGAVIRSTIERPYGKGEWLVENGDFIQIMVLQNYLFFGNASSVYNYISSMFQRSTESERESRRPKFLIVDLTLVTGMDTSTVDIFNEIKNLCKSNHCKMFTTGLTPNLRAILSLGGFKPETGQRSKRHLRFFASLDAALGKAEDLLLDAEEDDLNKPTRIDNRVRLLSESDFGFRTALRCIDEEHNNKFSLDLVGWQAHTRLVELNPGDHLYHAGSEDLERGLFFIEAGVLKIEKDTSATLTNNRTIKSGFTSNTDSLSHIQAMEYKNILEASQKEPTTFRLARFGPGWIAGTLEAVSGVQRPGDHIAVTQCRLHHLPFSKIVEMEKENPSLVLSLYKLLAYMMARRQEKTIGQLATLHSIMGSPANLKAL